MKRWIISVIAAGVLLAAALFSAGAEALPSADLPRVGDVDQNGRTDVCDLTRLQRHLAEIEPADDMQAADVNGDGSVTIEDITELQRLLAEFITESDLALDRSAVRAYYSDIAAALGDANAQTTANADLPNAAGAAVSLSFDENGARLRLLGDCPQTQALTVARNTDINLCGCSLGFSENAGLTCGADLSLRGGVVSGATRGVLLEQADNGADVTLSLSGVTLNAVLDDSAGTGEVCALLMRRGTFTVTDSTVSAVVVNNSDSVRNYSVKTLTPTATVLRNSVFKGSADETVSRFYNVNTLGSVTVEGCTVKNTMDIGAGCFGLFMQGAASENSVEDSAFVMRVTSDGDRAAHLYCLCAYGVKSLATRATRVDARYDLLNERTDAAYSCYSRGVFVYNAEAYTSVSDTVRMTSGTLNNNVLYSTAMCLDNAPATVDHIYAFVPSQPSFVSTSDGRGYGLRVLDSALTLTENRGANYIHGAHSGISAVGATDLDIYGGRFESPAHGGLYYNGTTGSTLNIYGGEFINTRGMLDDDAPEPYSESPEVGVQGALYIGSLGAQANIDNAYIFGGRQGLRIKRYSGDGINTYVEVNVDNSYICGEWYAIADNLRAGEGTLTIGSGVTLEHGDGTLVGTKRPPVPPADISTYNADFPDNHPDITDNRTA